MHQERRFPGRVVGTDLAQPRLRRLRAAPSARYGENVERTEDFPAALERALAVGQRGRRRAAARPGGDHAAHDAQRAVGSRRRERSEYNALITPLEPRASARRAALAGRRLAVKDLIDTAGIRTTYGSAIYADHVPERTAPAVERLLAAGAVWSARRTCTSSPGA